MSTKDILDFEKITYFLSTNLNKEKIKEKVELYNNFGNERSKDYNKSINYITENMLPVSYIPFIYNDNKGINYRNIYSINEIVGIYDDTIITNTNLESKLTTERLNNNLKNALENIESPTKCYNSFNIDNLIFFCIISWIIVFVLVLKWVYYYYKDIYIYILITFMIILLTIAVIFKMTMTLNY